MKISFSNFGSSSNRRVTWYAISLVSLLAGSYLVGRYWGLLIVLLLGVVGIMIGRVVSARLESNNNFDRPQTVPAWKETPQIIRWDYRPRGAARRRADIDLVAETATDSGPSRSAANENTWLDALDSSALDPEPTVEEATQKAPLPDRAVDMVGAERIVDDAALSRYDQSPIEERTAIAE
jgi:hypothetical protein